jgi:hypothetical protein
VNVELGQQHKSRARLPGGRTPTMAGGGRPPSKDRRDGPPLRRGLDDRADRPSCARSTRWPSTKPANVHTVEKRSALLTEQKQDLANWLAMRTLSRPVRHVVRGEPELQRRECLGP